MTNNNERAKLFLFYFVVVFLLAVFFLTPSLQLISCITVLNVLFLAPIVGYLHSRKINRIFAIFIVFAVAGVIMGILIDWLSGVVMSQGKMLIEALPGFSNNLLEKIRTFETAIQEKFHLQFQFGLSTMVSQTGSSSTSWLLSHATGFLSNIATVALLVPIFSFFILKDGEKYKAEILRLVPKHYYSEVVTTFGKTLNALSRFLRAKALEALLVGALVYVGLLICGTPYAAVLAIVAAVTNILPYIGPVLGIIPAIAVLGFSWPVVLVYVIVNALDLIVIFPVMVGKLVNLSPLTLLVAVAVGQELYGLLGMLLSVPVASSIKIVYQEVYQVLYRSSESKA